jgi:preprotein translocase subunit SecG
MATILFIVQIFIVIALVGAILLQKTGSDGLSGLSGGGHNAISSRASSTAFTKVTAFLAALFIINSLALAKIATYDVKSNSKSLEDAISEQQFKVEPLEQKQVPIAD